MGRTSIDSNNKRVVLEVATDGWEVNDRLDTLSR